MGDGGDVGGFHRHQRPLVRIVAHGNGAAGQDVGAVGQHEAAGLRVLRDLVQRQHGIRAQRDVGDLVALDLRRRMLSQRHGVIDRLDLLDDDLHFAGLQPQAIGVAALQRFAAQPEQPGVEDVGLDRRLCLVAGDLAPPRNSCSSMVMPMDLPGPTSSGAAACQASMVLTLRALVGGREQQPVADLAGGRWRCAPPGCAGRRTCRCPGSAGAGANAPSSPWPWKLSSADTRVALRTRPCAPSGA